ncbi:DUF5671 domain-containing protein [Salsipaludibacter albus]|uniref:DUF5671 domain-containing protein n=1 Tax=Salsipaludibacter albus TaxID=2849650 RepID=UPI001EE45A42|nr:DUF5671 domain-containing protein [Salsipaludibacter albus]MBY5162923.1 hypothetical protein [Salsipaludibacter albus]
MMLLGLFGSLLPLLVLAGIVAAVVRSVRGHDVDWGELVRRFFVHLIAVSLAFVATTGVAQLATLALEGPSLLPNDDRLAAPLAFAVVGAPLYAAMMWWLLGQARRDRAEARTLAWSLHLGVVAIVALVVAMVGVFELVDLLTGGEATPWGPLANIVVWGGLWAWYRWLEDHLVGSQRWAVLQVIVGSAIGLGTLVVGVGQLVSAGVEALLFGRDVIVSTDDPWTAITATVVGAGVWTAYWLLRGMRRRRDGWWHGWVLLGGVFGGLVTAVSSAGYLLWLVAVWLVGDPGGGASATAADHFDEVPGAVAAMLVGGAVWAWHRSILAPRAERARTEVDRVYDLLLAGVGLVAAAGGFATVLVAILEVVAGPGVVESGTDPVNTLLAALTFLAVGTPLWWRAWSRVQRLALAPPLGGAGPPPELDDRAAAERRSPTRRVYLFALFGIGGLTALVALLSAVVIGFEDLFSGGSGAETLSAIRIPVAILVTSVAVAALHWRVYREDREVVADAPRRFPARVTLVGVADDAIVDALHDATDAKVSLLVRTDGPTPPWSVERLVAALDGHGDDHVLVVSRPDGLEFIPVA